MQVFSTFILAAANRQKSRHGRNLEECDKSGSLLRHFSTAARRKRWKRASTPEADRSKLPVQADRTLSSVLFEILFENFHQNFPIYLVSKLPMCRLNTLLSLVQYRSKLPVQADRTLSDVSFEILVHTNCTHSNVFFKIVQNWWFI